VLIGVSSLVLAASASAQFKTNVVVEITGTRDQRGNVCVGLFSSSKNFPEKDDGLYKRQCVPAKTETIIVKFTNVPSGSYAIATLHDRNKDGLLSRNAAGIPNEGYGFSNNPVIRTGPPGFGKCLFLVAGPETTVDIEMRYFPGMR
jgi:uncharacterized protein (DUF2141 family)